MKSDKNQDFDTPRDPFKLTDLKPLEPPTDGWAQIESALRRRHLIRRASVYMASAAVVTLALGIYWQMPHIPTASESPQSFAEETRVTSSEADTDSSKDTNLKALVSLSQRLERNLRVIRDEVGVMPGQTLIYQVELEDLVAQVDEAINRQPDSVSLWGQRVNLLLDLNQLYRHQLRRDYSDVASL